MSARTSANHKAPRRLCLPSRSTSAHLISRRKLEGPGRHYGVQFGRVVLELQKKDGVQTISIDEFARGRPVLIELKVQGKVARAALHRARVARESFSTYRLLDGNCEHFARYIIEGLRKSNQISVLLVAGVAAVLFIGLMR